MAVGIPGWFSFAAPPAPAGQPRILGVIFHSQIKSGGYNSTRRRDVDEVLFNYSLDGSQKGLLKQDINLVGGSNLHYWVDGYHDASEDRDWSWEDLGRIRAKFQVLPKGKGDKNLLAGAWVVVRYFQPADTAPVFYARVDERSCRELELKAGAWRMGSQTLGGDPVALRVNPALCAPTPAPTATPLPVIVTQPRPTSTPESGLSMLGAAAGLGCLDSAPKPFRRGGVFIYFCLKEAAQLRLNVYSAAGGAPIRSMDAGEYRAGQKLELYFNGMDGHGKSLKSGRYIFELEASTKSGRKELRQQEFEKAQN
jgi:hypothetical protein